MIDINVETAQRNHEIEVPFDENLPTLQDAIDMEHMLTVFRRMLELKQESERQLRVDTCRIQRIRYKPGQNCHICYLLTLHDLDSGVKSEQIIGARIYPSGGSTRRYQRALAGGTVPTPLPLELVHDEKLELVGWVFPNDRKLAHLDRLQNPAFLHGDILPAVFKDDISDGWHIAGSVQELIHYVPERSCTVRVVVSLNNKLTASTRRVAIYGKHFYDDSGAETWRLMRALRGLPNRLTGFLQTAQPLAYFPDYKLLLQSEIPGRTLLSTGFGSQKFMQLLPAAARTVVALHRSGVEVRHTRDRETLFVQLQRVEALLGMLYPAHSAQAREIISGMIEQANPLDGRFNVVLHGDLHLKNFLANGRSIALIDMDNLAMGPPAEDIGSFIAGVCYRGLLENRSAGSIQPVISQFLEAYRNAAPWYLRQYDLNWYAAAALLGERVFRSISRLKAGRLNIIDDLLNLAQTLVNQNRSTGRK